MVREPHTDDSNRCECNYNWVCAGNTIPVELEKTVTFASKDTHNSIFMNLSRLLLKINYVFRNSQIFQHLLKILCNEY